MRNVAVLERAYIGSGNVGRNTTLIRSNYVIDGNTQFFEHSMKLWEGLSHELNFNCMVSHRGQVVLATSPVQLDTFARRGNIMRLNGIDAELLDRGQVMALLPYLDYSKEARWPIWGGILQERAGNVRHDAVGTLQENTGYVGYGLAVTNALKLNANVSHAFHTPPQGFLFSPVFGKPPLYPEKTRS